MPPFLAVGQPWPPTNVHGVNYATVFQDIRDNRELFKGIHTRVFEEQYKRLRPAATDATENTDPVTMTELLVRLAAAAGQTAFEQEIDLPQALSLLWADMIAGRPPRVSAGVFAGTSGNAGGDQTSAKPGDAEETALQRLTTDIVSEIHEAITEQSYAGDGVFYAQWSREGGGQVVAYPADQFIPWSVTGDPKKVACYVCFRQEPEKMQTIAPTEEAALASASLLSVEIHYRGMVRYRRYRVAGGKITNELDPVLGDGMVADQLLQGVTEFLVQPFKNFGTPGDWRGISDYNAIETLVAEFDVRSSQWGKLNDKFTAPTMHGPASILEHDEENPGHWVYKTSPDGKYIPRDEDDPEPGYLVWDPQFQMQLETWDRLLEAFFIASGTNPAVFSIFKDSGGGSLSGIALRLRLARPLQVAGRKRERVEPALRRALLAAQQLEKAMGDAKYRPTLPVFEWSDGLPSDPKEAAETEAARKNAGLTSTKRAVMRLDGLSEAEADAEADEIRKEDMATRPTPTLIRPGREGSPDLEDEEPGGEA